MDCQVSPEESWLPHALQTRLLDGLSDDVDRIGPDVKNWLNLLRITVHDYEDKPKRARKPSAVSEFEQNIDFIDQNAKRISGEVVLGAEKREDLYTAIFDDILSNLGNEIFQLDTYHQKYFQEPPGSDSSEFEHNIMHVFDEFLDEVRSSTSPQGDNKTLTREAKNSYYNSNSNNELTVPSIAKIPSFGNLSTLSDEVFFKSATSSRSASTTNIDSSDKDSDVVVIRNFSRKADNKKYNSFDINRIFDMGDGVPVPPRRKSRQSIPIPAQRTHLVKPIPKPRDQSNIGIIRNKTSGRALIAERSSFKAGSYYRVHKNGSDSGNTSPVSDHSDYQNLWNCTSGNQKRVISYDPYRENYGTVNMIRYDSFRDISKLTPDAPRQRIVVCGPYTLAADTSHSDGFKSESKRRDRDAKSVPVFEAAIKCTPECDITDDCHRSFPQYANLSQVGLESFGSFGVPRRDFESSVCCEGVVRKNQSDYASDCGDSVSMYSAEYPHAVTTTEEEWETSAEILSDSDSFRAGGVVAARGRIESDSTEYASESPIYENLRESMVLHKPVPDDVIAWKESLMDPDYIDDEEDEWVHSTDDNDRRTDHLPMVPKSQHGAWKQSGDQRGVWRPPGEAWRPPPEQLGVWRPPGDKWKPPGDENRFRDRHRSDGDEEILSCSRDKVKQMKEMLENRIVYQKHDLPLLKKTYTHQSTEYTRYNQSPDSTDSTLREEAIRNNTILNGIFKVAVKTQKSSKKWVQSAVLLTKDELIFDNPVNNNEKIIFGVKDRTLDVKCKKNKLYIRNSTIENYYVIEQSTEKEAKYWYDTIMKFQPKVETNSSYRNPTESPPSTPSSNRKKSPKASEENLDDLVDSQENAKNKSSTSTFLDKFLRKRPQVDTLISQGIYKDEAVFGRNLSDVCHGDEKIPTFVKRCVQAIEATDQNITTDGIYRASGNLSEIQRIRLQVDQNKMSVLDAKVDVHVLTGALKLFFRELKEPLIPFAAFRPTLKATGIQDRVARNEEFRRIIKSLPVCNRETLKFVLEHLLKVTAMKEHNRMHISNIAIVLGPTLLWAPHDVVHDMTIDFLQQNQVIECYLNDFHEIFGDRVEGNAYKPKMATEIISVPYRQSS